MFFGIPPSMAAPIALAVLFSCIYFEPATAAQNVTDENMTQMLRQTLKDRPDLVLDVLRQNSEAVLEVAQQGSLLRRKRALEAQWREDIKQPKKVSLEGRPALGSGLAPITIIAFSDFTCPYCEQGAMTVQRLYESYGEKVRYIFKHTPLGKDNIARLASEYFVATSLQSPEKAWKLYNEFFGQRERLLAEGESYMKVCASNAGVNMQKLAADITGKKVKDIIDEDLADAKRLGVEGTPYFLVNNLVVRGALPQELFKDAVDLALQHVEKK